MSKHEFLCREIIKVEKIDDDCCALRLGLNHLLDVIIDKKDAVYLAKQFNLTVFERNVKL